MDRKIKNAVFMFVLILIYQLGYGQDKITTKDKKQFNVWISEQTDRYVKYRMPDYETGPIIMMKTNRIRKIEYSNGVTDLMGYQNPRKNKSFGISAGYAADITGGGALFSGTVDYFVIPQIDLEMDLGTSDLSGGLYYAAGARVHVNSTYSEQKITPFTGLLGGTYYGDAIVQVPLGISYISPIGINASLSVNELISFNSWQSTFIELRLGWRFKL